MSGTVPRLFPGSTIVCVASGPSLTVGDVAYCEGRARVVAVKDAIRLAPWADVLYVAGADNVIGLPGRWWVKYGPTLGFAGPRFTLDPQARQWATVLKDTGYTGIETDPCGLRTGKNSGYQAIGVAAHLGAKRIVLLGYDMQEGPNREQRWFGAHAWPTRSWNELGRMMAPLFETLVEPAKALGIEIINASRQTALTCFPRMSIQDALSGSEQAAA